MIYRIFGYDLIVTKLCIFFYCYLIIEKDIMVTELA